MKRFFFQSLLCLVFSILIELIICNFTFFRFPLKGGEQLSLNTSTAICSEGLVENSDGDYTIAADPAILTFDNLNTKVNSLYLDIIPLEQHNNVVIPVSLSVSDDGSYKDYTIGNRDIISSEPHSKWFETELYGKCHSLSITFHLNKGESFHINSIQLNQNIPLSTSIERIVFLFLIMLCINVLRPDSEWHACKLFPIRKEYLFCLLTVFILFAGFWIHFLQDSHDYYSSHTQIANQNQYDRLVHSFLNGHTYLDDSVPDFLIDMENPYDASLRGDLAEQYAAEIPWDNAYYNGHYYVYFGVLPVLLFYIPYYLLTGHDLPNKLAVLCICILLIPAIYHLLYSICKKWFKDVSFITYLFTGIVLISGCGTCLSMSRATLYELPIILGVLLAIVGLDFWICALTNDFQIQNKLALFIGSLFIALITASRPTVFFVFLTSFVLFYSLIIPWKKENLTALAIFSIPFLLVATVLMWYNYIRFGSPFDFGANYNLTFNDMTKRGFRITRIGYGLYDFFIKPLEISSIFPFIVERASSTEYIGKTIYEKTYGGVLWMCPFLFSICFLPYIRRHTNMHKSLIRFCYASILISLLIAILDANIAGILPRYAMDFSYLLLLTATLIYFYLSTNLKNKILIHYFRLGFMLLSFATIATNFLVMFHRLEKCNLMAFYHYKYIFQFWS